VTSNLKSIAIIPARYGSVRFPGKPLFEIMGKSLIQRTYENAALCPLLSSIIVATDDLRIYNHVKEFGGNAAMTSPHCTNGTERLAELYSQKYLQDEIDVIINIQGDEPCLDPNAISAIIKLLASDPQAVMSTAAVKITSEEEALNPSCVKCTVDLKGNALYFSRSLIPGSKTGKYDPKKTYLKHLGVYGYRPSFLLKYSKLKETPLQAEEDLEQLKVIENGYRIKVALVESHCVGVDTPEDIKKVENILCKQNSFS